MDVKAVHEMGRVSKSADHCTEDKVVEAGSSRQSPRACFEELALGSCYIKALRNFKELPSPHASHDDPSDSWRVHFVEADGGSFSWGAAPSLPKGAGSAALSDT